MERPCSTGRQERNCHRGKPQQSSLSASTPDKAGLPSMGPPEVRLRIDSLVHPGPPQSASAQPCHGTESVPTPDRFGIPKRRYSGVGGGILRFANKSSTEATGTRYGRPAAHTSITSRIDESHRTSETTICMLRKRNRDGSRGGHQNNK